MICVAACQTVTSPDKDTHAPRERAEYDTQDNEFQPSFLYINAFKSNQIHNTSPHAKKCENYARHRFANSEWLEPCNLALQNTNISNQNRYATLYNRGLIYMHMEDIDAARQDFNEALKLRPNLGDPYLMYAIMALNQSEYERSLEFVEKGLETGVRKNRLAYHIQARALEGLFDFDGARAAYKKALTNDPGLSRIRRDYERLNRLWPEGRQSDK